MKTYFLVLLTSLLLGNTFNFQSQEPPELKEATDLTASVVKLFNENKFDEALPLAKRALEMRERLLPHASRRRLGISAMFTCRNVTNESPVSIESECEL